MRLFLVLSFFLAALPAYAWVSAFAPSGCFERWYTPDPAAVKVTIATDTAGIGSISASDVHTAAVSAMKTWNDVQCGLCSNPGGAGCAPLTCATNPLGATLADGGIAPHTPWGLNCAPNSNPCQESPNGSYVVGVTKTSDWLWGQYAASITPIVSNSATGEIVDADVLFNLAPPADGSAPFSFCQGDCAAKKGAYPLCIVLTHEFGHLLGMGHSLDPKATMFASAVPTDTYKCDLSDDDTLGVCTVYRETCSGIPSELSLTTAQCAANAVTATTTPTTPTPTSSCQASGRAGSSSLIWILLAAISLVRLGSGKLPARRK